MSGQVSTILDRQNSPAMVPLLRAISVSHARARRLDNLHMAASTAIAGLGILAVFVAPTATAVTLIGAAWALAYSIGLDSWTHSELRRAALLQERFDVSLFKLPWNGVAAGEQLGREEISRIAQQYRGSDEHLRDYYEIPAVARPYDVIACQLQNLGWGSRIRRRYAQAVLASLAAWFVIGIAIGVLAGLSVAELLLRWYIPSLGASLLALHTYRGQRDIAQERDRVLAIVRRAVQRSISGGHRAEDDLLTLARQVQDLLFATRQQQSRVPDWFFLRFRQRDRADFREAMAELAGALRVE